MHEVMRLQQLLAGSDSRSTRPDIWVDTAHAFLNDATEAEQARVVVAEHSTNPGVLIAVGVAVIMQMQPTYWLPDGRLGYLQSFYTETEWRGQGIGTEILTEQLNWFEKQRAKEVHLYATSEDGIRFYERCGFSESDDYNMWLRQCPSP